jgi:hypothetical protein
LAELAQLEAESVGWIQLNDGACLHVDSEDGIVEIVGVAGVGMANSNLLWIV